MNDYKELVEKLRNAAGGDLGRKMCKDAADAIEQLVKERDVAVADLRAVITSSDAWLNFCDFCKHQEPDGQCFHDCTPCNDKWGWQWRGVQEGFKWVE